MRSSMRRLRIATATEKRSHHIWRSAVTAWTGSPAAFAAARARFQVLVVELAAHATEGGPCCGGVRIVVRVAICGALGVFGGRGIAE